MKAYLCDKCGIRLSDGPVGAYYNVGIEFQPAYAPVEYVANLNLCSTHTQMLRDWVGEFLRTPDASED